MTNIAPKPIALPPDPEPPPTDPQPIDPHATLGRCQSCRRGVTAATLGLAAVEGIWCVGCAGGCGVEIGGES